ncbi:Dyp-type peroxidase [Paraneptunicella aestuarii]|uniref:Dyp-type peroxidase n=1 Tax=Paraneptunicella aestuarii TaxID=2831148 RepID=UPI001E2EB99B|nr:Dyp-type peroxidase [Paraneptunicella aestuarii]UAA38455.1 Dyp-type peroxidase [Paraneptunicella aestuarii]
MPQAQKGICAEPNLHALYLMFNVHEDHDEEVRRILAQILNIFDHYDDEHYEAMVSGVIAIGSNYWMELYPGFLPAELAPFPDMHCEDRHAPVVPCDLFIQMRADRADICHAMGTAVYDALKPHVELVEQIKGFRFLDGRDLTGFVDGTENPKGMHKLDVAIIGDEDPEFAGGSYIHIQRYRHNLSKWNQLDVPHQEEIFGRTKTDDIEFASEMKKPFAHTKRTNLKDANGNSIEILRQSMPYGDMKEQGLFFVSCAKSPQPFTKMLESMIFGDAHGNYDKLMDYTTAETGAAFFAPSVDFLKFQGMS